MISSATWIGHPALGHRHSILVEVLAIDASQHVDIRVGVEGLTRRSDGVPVERGKARDPLHPRQPRDGANQAWVVPGLIGDRRAVEGRPDAQIRGIGAGQERRERGLGSPSGRDRAHGQSPDEPDQHDEGEVACPPTPQGGPEAVPGDVQQAPVPTRLGCGRLVHVPTSQPRSLSTDRAASSPHIPWTPPPGGVDEEQR